MLGPQVFGNSQSNDDRSVGIFSHIDTTNGTDSDVRISCCIRLTTGFQG